MSSTPTVACGRMTMRPQGNHLDVNISRMQLYCGRGDQDEMRRNFDRELKARLEASDIPGLLNHMALYAEKEPKTVYIQAVHVPNAHDAHGAAQAFVNAVREKLLELAGHSFERHKRYTMEVPKQPFIPTFTREFAWPSYTYDDMGNPVYPEPVFQEAPPVHIAADGTRTEGWLEAKAARDAEMLSLGRVAAVEHKTDNRPSPYVRFQDRLDQGQDTEGLSEALNAIACAWGTINNLKNAYTGFTDGVLDGLLYDILIPAVSGVTDAIYGSLGYFVTGGTGFREENRRTGERIFSLAKKIATLEISENFAQWLNITLSKFQYAKTPKELGRALVNLMEVATIIFGNEITLLRVGAPKAPPKSGPKTPHMGSGKPGTKNTPSQQKGPKPKPEPIPETDYSNAKQYTPDMELRAKDIKEKAYTIEGGYELNKTAVNINSLLDIGGSIRGRINGKLMTINGKPMFVIDLHGNIIIGNRVHGYTPHPTLIGGFQPKVVAAGMVEIRKGKIYSINNSSGHFKPGPETISIIKERFSKVPSKYFHKEFQGYLSYETK